MGARLWRATDLGHRWDLDRLQLVLRTRRRIAEIQSQSQGITSRFRLARLAYAGTCPANNTTYDMLIAPTAYNGTSGWLEVAGTLWLCGNGKLNAAAHTGQTAFAKFQIDTGGKFVFDNNNNASVAYRIIPGGTLGWNNFIAGTLGDTCTFGASYSCPTNIISINNGTVNPLLILGQRHHRRHDVPDLRDGDRELRVCDRGVSGVCYGQRGLPRLR